MNTIQGASETISINVAYAEDHDLVRGTVIEYLENLGGIKVIIEAGNGRELISRIEDSSVMPDVCLVDIIMPEMNGFETVANIKRKWNDIKILVLSGFLSEEYLIKMILAGANGYLTKKVKPREIKKAIEDVHEFGLYNSELFTPRFINDVRNKRIALPQLTGKEIQLLKLSIEDKTFDEIAQLMNTSSKSIEGHRNRLYTKLGIKTRAGLAIYAVRFGYVAIDPGISPL